MTSPDGTWLTIQEAAVAAHTTAKAIRRRIERGTCASELRSGRRYVLLESLNAPPAPPAPAPAGSPDLSPSLPLGEVLDKLERQAAELGKLRALEEVSRTTAEAAQAEAIQLRAELKTAELRLAELEAAAAAKGGWFRRNILRQPSEGRSLEGAGNTGS